MLKLANASLRAAAATCLLLFLAACSTGSQNVSVAIVTTSLPAATVGASYSASIAASGGAPPYLFSIPTGSLPTGLFLSSAGALTGVPTTAATVAFTVTVADANAVHASKALTLTIGAGATSPITISPSTLTAGTVGMSYSATLTAANGTAPYTFALSGTLPGLSLSTAGLLSGVPTASGAFPFSVTVTDAKGLTATAPYTLTIAPSTSTITLGPATPPPPPSSAPLTPPPSPPPTPPLRTPITLTSSTLPSTFTFTNGTLSGTPTVSGTYTFTAKAVDSSSPQQSISATFTLNVVTATVAVNTGTVLTTVPQTFFGMHTSVYDTALNDTAKLPALLATTGITTLRYPGGSYADRYHWAQASLTPERVSTNPGCPENLDNQLGIGADFGSFIKTVIATGTQPLITVNYGTSVANSSASLSAGTYGVLNHCSEPNTAGQPQEAAAWVAYANGLPTNTQSIGIDAVGFDWHTVGFWASLRAASPPHLRRRLQLPPPRPPRPPSPSSTGRSATRSTTTAGPATIPKPTSTPPTSTPTATRTGTGPSTPPTAPATTPSRPPPTASTSAPSSPP